MIEGIVPFGGRDYFLFLTLLALGRGLDFFSTWLATPNLVLEANPIAKRLGWRWGIPLNVVVILVLAVWPFPALVVSTTSLLVASRNLQSAWLMRSMGEHAYLAWLSARIRASSRSSFLFCLVTQSLVYLGLGAALVVWGWAGLVPVGIGFGMAVYGVAVLLYTTLSVWRIWRRPV